MKCSQFQCPASPRSGRARAEAIYTIIYSGSVDVLVALALLLLVLAPQAIYTLALLMIELLLPLLCCFCSWCWRSCSCPSCCSRYSCVACSAWGSLASRAFLDPKNTVCFCVLGTLGVKLLLQLGSWLGGAPGGLPGAILESFWALLGVPNRIQSGPKKRGEI